ncbi:AAA family ATPase [Cytobacillus suaedae]|nr:AAA family ATPase [Cytobacillus suaedae]
MRIIDLQIYGYGKLENKEYGNLSHGIQLFYGKNEAGKSTLMSFIHSILFGFPTKQQQDLRYEPKSGTRYGGKITLQTKEYGAIVIERLPGKASGNVTVYMPDGTTMGEDLLKELFQGMDKSFYQGVYSYNLQGLQGVQQMNAEKLGNYLFSAGVVGTDALVKVNDRITKELESLFKPSGRKPIINQQLIDLKEKHQLFVQAQEKNYTYKKLLEDKEDLQQKLQDIEREVSKITNECRQLEHLLSINDLLIERQTIQTKLSSLPTSEPFPVDGLKRLEHLQSQLLPYKAQLSSLSQKKMKLENDIENCIVNEELLNRGPAIREVGDNVRLYEQLQVEISEHTREIAHLNEFISSTMEQVGWTNLEEEILHLDTSISKKEEIKTVVNEFDVIKQQKQFLDDQFSRSKMLLEASEEKIHDLQKQLLSIEARKNYEEILHASSTSNENLIERSKVIDLLSTTEDKIKRYSSQEKTRIKNTKVLFSSFCLVLTALLIWLILNNQWIVVGAVLVVSVLTFVFMKNTIMQGTSHILKDLKHDKSQLEQKLGKLNENISAGDKGSKEIEEAQERLIKDRELNRLLDIETITLSQNERQYEKVLSEYDTWENRRFSNHERVAEIIKELHLSETLSGGKLFDSYILLEELKTTFRKKKKHTEQLEAARTKALQFEQKVKVLCEQANSHEIVSTVYTLLTRLESEKEKKGELLHLTGKLEDIIEQTTQLQLEINYLEQECTQLYEMAEVSNEEEYRSKGKIFEQKAHLNGRLELLESQVGSYLHLIDEGYLEDETRVQLNSLKESIENLKLNEKNFRHRLSEISIRIEDLEEGGTYAEIFHTYEQSKSFFQQEVKKWAVHSVAKDILGKSIERYRALRLPRLLSDAEEYFRFLTDEAYIHIYSPDDVSGFIVERKDGVRFSPSELSQATAEQLYLSLRIALGKTMHPMTAYPFIVDDSFVNFDQHRTEKIISLLQTLSANHQILLFTCHKHIVDHFQTEDVVYL